MVRLMTMVAAMVALALTALAETPAPQAKVPAQPPEVTAAEEEQAKPDYPIFHLMGFTDFNFSATDASSPPPNSGFFEGQFVLHGIAVLSPRFSYFGEVSVTALPGATTSSDPHAFRTEIERTILKYDQSDYLKLSFGRYHTPINYWNTTFHHGQWLQTTISRPEMTRFGGDFIPVHFVGGLVEGSVGAAGLNLNYNLGVGNGRSSIISRGGDPGDVNNSRAYLGNFFIRPDRFYSLQVGGSFYVDRVTIGARNFDETITSAHLVWTKENPEFLAEYANIRHRELGKTSDTNNRAYYVQVAERLPFWKEKVKPYVRYEDMKINPADFVLSRSLKNRKVTTGGVRLEVGDLVALKVEYRRQKTEGSAKVDGAFAQLSFTF